jgi:antitoxin HicB
MSNYSCRVFWSESDGAYVSVCPEFPRLSGIGPTAGGALSELHEVLEEAVEIYRQEGWPLSSPAQESGFSGQFRVRVARSVHAALATRAEMEGISMNSLVTQYLAQGLGHDAALADSEH